jgi:hypothetical protein
MAVRVTLGVRATFLVFLAMAVESRGCTCITVPLRTAFIGATDVFVGTTVEDRGFTRTDPYDRTRQIYVPTVAVMRVERRFLGAGPSRVEVHLDSCGGLPKGSAVLVFAHRDQEGRIFNQGCLSLPLKRGAGARRRLERRAWLWRVERRVRSWWPHS